MIYWQKNAIMPLKILKIAENSWTKLIHDANTFCHKNTRIKTKENVSVLLFGGHADATKWTLSSITLSKTSSPHPLLSSEP